METTPFYRVRWLLRARQWIRLPCLPAGVIYALLCEASRGVQVESHTSIPKGLLLEAPETARIEVAPGDTYALGATLIESDSGPAARRLHELSAGLARVGQTIPAKPVVLGGNFDLIAVRDLVAQADLAPGDPFQPVPRAWITAEIERLGDRFETPFTLRFHAPLRLKLPGAEASEGHEYADERHLNAGQLLRTIQKRLAAIGISRVPGEPETPFGDDCIELIENRLVWTDLGYGPRKVKKGTAKSPGQTTGRTSLGGSLGRLIVRVPDPVARAALAWGQYTHVGRDLNFGFGGYRIEELGPSPARCGRSIGLLDTMLSTERIKAAAAQDDLLVAELEPAVQQLRTGTHTPGPHHTLELAEADGGSRKLQIPTRIDRALQRLLLGRLAPAFDQLFEGSSFAGLDRKRADREFEKLIEEGWVYCFRAHFDRYLDSVPQRFLADRLEAWLGCDEIAAALMEFVRSGSPGGVGLASGAPLSPMLGKVLLGRYHEEIDQAEGRLVRHEDELLILTKTAEAARRLQGHVRDLAEAGSVEDASRG